MPYVWLNNNFVPEDQAAVSVRDTGLLHAAGLFTTMRAYQGRVFRLSDHLARLRRSCDHLFVPLPYKDDLLQSAIAELLERNELADARLRLTVTRGATTPDPLHGLRMESTVFLTATPLEPYPPEFYQRGMTVIAYDEQKLNPYDIQAGHKTLNYFSRLAALRSATTGGAGEALLFNVHNYLQSGCITNVFLAKDGTLFTPPTPQDLQDSAIAQRTPYLRSATLPGITRKVLLELAQRDGIPTQIASLTINELLAADEVILTNSIVGLMPACRIERHPIGNDRPGPLFRQLSEAYDAEIQRTLS